MVNKRSVLLLSVSLLLLVSVLLLSKDLYEEADSPEGGDLILYRYRLSALKGNTEELLYAMNLFMARPSEAGRVRLSEILESGLILSEEFQAHTVDREKDSDEWLYIGTRIDLWGRVTSWAENFQGGESPVFGELLAEVTEMGMRENGLLEKTAGVMENILRERKSSLKRKYTALKLTVIFTQFFLVILFLLGTKNKLINRKLMVSEKRFRMIFDESYHFIGILDERGIIRDVNKTALELFGLEKTAIMGKPLIDTFWWDHFEESKKTMVTALELAGNGKTSLFEAIHTDSAGNPIYVDVAVKPVMTGGVNSVEQIIIEGMDITRRKMTEERLAQLRNFLKDIFNSMPTRLLVVDKSLRLTLVNSKALDDLGLSLEDVTERRVGDVYEFLNVYEDVILDCISSGESRSLNKQKCRERGNIRYNNITVFPLDGEEYEGAAISIEDITDSRRIEDLMIQSEKMISVGGLAAGMAHELNNPLAGMIQTAEVLQNRLGDLDIPANKKTAEKNGIDIAKLRKYMEDRQILPMLASIREAGSRASDIIENMLTFVKREGSAVSTHNLPDLLDQTLELARTDYDLKNLFDFDDVTIIRQIEERIPSIPCEGVKIQQVILSIIKNGVEAMSDDRKARERQGLPMVGSRMIFRIKYDDREKMVILEIEDNGPGMKESVRKRVFEPFYTTKSIGKGTGLGLSVSFFIIHENHRGSLSVESEEGMGAKFIIKLPADRQDT